MASKNSDRAFVAGLALIGGFYLLLIVAMLVADASFTTPNRVWDALKVPESRYSIKLSLITCSLTALLSVWVATPIGYVLSRFNFPGKSIVEAVLDIPIVLPPLVVGLSLLILFQTLPGKIIERFIPMTYATPGIVLAQFSVACAFAARTMRGTFEQISPRGEQVAMTLGCSRAQAFWRVALPEARHGLLTAATLA